MRILIILLTFTLSGCITSSYKQTADSEVFKVTSIFKSVDGLRAERDGFLITVDKTSSQTQQINAMMEMLFRMYVPDLE